MSLFTVGRLCVKIAGRDAGRTCVVVDTVDGHFVVVDGDVRRKKVNVQHLEPLEQVVQIRKGASHEDVKKAFTALKLSVWETKAKKAAARITKQKAKRQAPAAKEKRVKAAKTKAAEAAEPQGEKKAVVATA